MQLNWKLSVWAFALTFLFTSCEIENVDPEVDENEEPLTPVTINFWSNGVSIHENATTGIDIIVPFSGAAPKSGQIEIEFQSSHLTYGLHFVTAPALVNGNLSVPVEKGDVEIKFSFIPMNNLELNGHNDVLVKIIGATGGIQKGANLGYLITMLDDELIAKPKSYETHAGDIVKKIYEYDTQGRTAKVNWETQTPFVRSGTDTYFYDAAGKLTKITESDYLFTAYTWSNDRIIRSEKYSNATMTQYVDYHYDNNGRVEESAFYYRQSQGDFKLGLVISYLYFLDGNLYKIFKSVPIEGSTDLHIVSTQTYDGYVAGNNPFPMVNILPTINPQWKLPTFYQEEANGSILTYHITYQLNDQGQPLRRDVSGSGGSQVTYYSYY